MKHPESRINCVILWFLSTVRETIGNESPVGIGGKCLEETSRLIIPPCAEEQTRERNHTIPPPVGEPGIACNDRPQVRRTLSLTAIWLAIRRICRASNDKLIGGDCQPGKYRILLRQGIFGTIRRRQELLHPLLVARPGLLHRCLMLRATKFSLQLRFSAEYNGHAFPWNHLYTKCARLIHVLYIKKSTLRLTP